MAHQKTSRRPMLPKSVADELRERGTLLETSAAVRRALDSLSTHNLRRFVRAYRKYRKFRSFKLLHGIMIPMETACAAYQARLARLRELAETRG